MDGWDGTDGCYEYEGLGWGGWMDVMNMGGWLGGWWGWCVYLFVDTINRMI